MKIGILFLCCLLAGCVSARPGGSFDALSAEHAADARSLAAQTADELSARHAPAHTPLALHRAPGLFGETLETELRSRGFALTDAGSPLGVRYTVDCIQNTGGPALGYVQVSCTDNRFFSFTRPLGARPETETPQAPTARAPESLPVPEAIPAQTAAVPSAKTRPVSATATAGVIARRNGLPVGAFCRWNGVDADAMLEKGRPVYLAEPPARPVAAEPAVAEKGPHAPAVSSVSASPLETPAAAPSAVAPNPLKKAAEPASTEPLSPSATPPVASVQTAPVQTALADLTAVSGAAAQTEPAAHAVAVPLWEVSQGRMLREQLTDWAARAGYGLVWNAHNDYELRGSAAFHGEFIDAVKQFFAALQANGLAMRVTIYQGNQVMEVSEH